MTDRRDDVSTPPRAIAVMKQHGLHEPRAPQTPENWAPPQSDPLVQRAFTLGIVLAEVLGLGGRRPNPANKWRAVLETEIDVIEAARKEPWYRVTEGDLRWRVRAIQAERLARERGEEIVALKERFRSRDGGKAAWLDENEALLANNATLEADVAEARANCEACERRFLDLSARIAVQASTIDGLHAQLADAERTVEQYMRVNAEMAVGAAGGPAKPSIEAALAVITEVVAENRRLQARWERFEARKTRLLEALEEAARNE